MLTNVSMTRKTIISLHKPYWGKEEALALAGSLQRTNGVGDGFYTNKLNDVMKRLTHSSYVFAVPSCTQGLELACRVMDIGVGDEVIVPGFTLSASANCIVLTGARPVFADIEDDTYCIDPKSIERSITKKTKGIIRGICIIGVGVLFYLLSLGNFPFVWYSLTKLSFEASSLGKLFPISAQFFFFQNDVMYGTGGYHIGYWMNLLLWSIGLCVGIIRLLTPCVLSGKRGMWQELIVSTVFLSSFLIFCSVLPMKHAQYLILPAVFVVFYVADGIWDVWKNLQRTTIGQTIFFVGFCLSFFFFWRGYTLVTMPKLYWTNDNDIQKAGNIWNTIPLSEPIFDMVGLTMRYPQPYIAPVYPVGQIAPLISYPLPSLSEALEKTNTKYIYSGPEARFQTLSTEDQEYVQSNFYKVGDGTLWVRNDVDY